jgi:hypothetical protein
MSGGVAGRYGTVVDRFLAKVFVDWNTGCWEWSGGTSRGYGTFWLGYVNGKSKFIGAHVFSYEYFKGVPVQKGLELDHLCRIPQCINPDHLEPVTHKVNMLRGRTPASKNAVKTHCPNGHLLSGDNIYNITRGDRCCKICTQVTRKRRAIEISSSDRGGR